MSSPVRVLLVGAAGRMGRTVVDLAKADPKIQIVAECDLGDSIEAAMQNCDVIVDFSSTQFLYGFGDLCTRIYGSKGTADTHYGGNVHIGAKTGGYRGGMTSQIYKSGAVANINNFCQSVVSKKYINNAQQSADSTITCILGRTAAYENRLVTWDEIMKANLRIDPKLDLPANGPDWQG